jgi:hypothetical protein
MDIYIHADHVVHADTHLISSPHQQCLVVRSSDVLSASGLSRRPEDATRCSADKTQRVMALL